jgi:hypothetical protein
MASVTSGLVQRRSSVRQNAAMGHELPWASFRDMSARPPISDVTLRCDS